MKVSERDERLMAACIELARRGKGRVSPNPLVGAVIVKRGEIIGKGFHREFGSAHAEIRAIQNARAKLDGATLYVNLEPCSHFERKKTPPCTDAIISSGIRRVVVGMIDPNPLVKGRGIRELRSAGIEVRLGVLSDECRRLNEFFVKRATTGLPFVALKVAQTLDGKIAQFGGRSRWITSLESRTSAHRLRAEYDAVLIGATTAQLDNPRLNVRLVKGRNPTRVLLDGNLSTPLSCRLFTDSLRSQTIVYCREDGKQELAKKKTVLRSRGARVVEIAAGRDGFIDVRAVLRHLAVEGINSVLVEGGQHVFTEFLTQGLVDKAYFFVAPKIVGCNGLPVFGELSRGFRFLQFTSLHIEDVGNDILMEGYL